MDIAQLINSLKGVSGSGNVLSRVTELREKFGRLTMEPGDFARDDGSAMAAPIAYDLWYLWCHDNMMAHYYSGIDGDRYDYTDYLGEALWFLYDILPGLRPLKTLRNLDQIISSDHFDFIYLTMQTQWQNNGVFWINTIAFELRNKDLSIRFPSSGPAGGNESDYVGYLTFPVGQLGVMEVLSLIQQTSLEGYQFLSVDADTAHYLPKAELSGLSAAETPVCISPPEIFPPVRDDTNKCYGRHLIESAYLKCETAVTPQNTSDSEGNAPYAPVASRDLEILSPAVNDYPEKAEMKKWMRYWIHRDDTLPVPGEFIGILAKPVVAPPHVWWFQESCPFVYAGNWIETGNLTSGIVVLVVQEVDRTDGKKGCQYHVQVQGCTIHIDSTDYFPYAVGDRVAVLKIESTAARQESSFAWTAQTALTQDDRDKVNAKYIIIPATFYKVKH
jgi:hypothetical protein